MITKLERSSDRLLAYDVTGKLTREDYDRVIPELTGAIARFGKIRVLMHLHGVEGIEPAALWEELKFDVTHLKDVERTALVGDAEWQKWTARLGQWITDCRYFAPEQLEQAWEWLK